MPLVSCVTIVENFAVVSYCVFHTFAASYLKSLVVTLKRDHEFLFPTKNPLYNLAGTNGHVLTTSVCLVGIITCDDDGGRLKNSESTNLSVGLQAGQYRLPMLSAKTRLLAFQRAFERVKVSLSSEAANRLPILAASVVSARGRVFSDVARRLKQLGKGKNQVSLLDLKTALLILQKGSSSVSKSELIGSEPETADIVQLFESVGGNMDAKQAIEEALALDPEKRRILKTFGLSPPTGVLLYGPPGTGKTLLAKATSRLLKRQGGNVSSLGGSFLSLQASEIVRGEVGNSEKMLVAAFETARSNAPSVVFIDEFQALFMDRSGSGSGKLASTLLQCMDDVCRWREADNEANPSPPLEPNEEETAESSRVVVMGATNTPWMIDSAFLRSGRFDRVVHVGLPTLKERVSILRVHVKRMKLVSTERDYVERICKTLAEECDGFSGADLAALCRAAAVKCLSKGGQQIEDHHFYEARDGFTPSCGPEMAQRLANWRP
jgi:ATP-dependent 26S proteasome regulatory subunit